MIISKPTLIVDRARVERNIKRIAEKAALTSTELVPHFKTHQSLSIGDWFKTYGIQRITVSSVSMAKYFAAGGWQDIYIAFPLNLNELDDITQLAKSINLTVLVNRMEHLTGLITEVEENVNVKIEIETGANRSGVLPGSTSLITELLEKISASQHAFDGFYSHFGHTYKAKAKDEVIQIYTDSLSLLDELKDRFQAFNPQISVGDTPSASALDLYSNIKSVHAGNYVFYDLTQVQIGACNEDDIAVVLAVPIVSKNQEKLELVVYGGGIHLSKESLLSSEFNRPVFGKVVEFKDNDRTSSLPGCFVKSLSQEHGVIQVTQAVFDQFGIGDSLGILPVHSCMTADCMRGYDDTEGEKIDHLQGLAV